ncbi:trimethylamine-N-oxide reductase TorA [Pseudovibrio sp. Ad14]|nr:trimethylamine-N-oxide reductase TorA [Pseudovibrio sp. Ad14]KZL06927.1 Dimethyl sulfoxide/trimethylamine N-oxide reductase precursor [Pseudovibrio sp. Ad14]
MSKIIANYTSRRSFLKGASALGALGVLAPSIFSPRFAQAAVNGEVLSGCHWGAFRAVVKNGRWTEVKPWEQDPHPSHQLAGVMDSVYSPSRIKYPMVRRAYLEKGRGADVEDRGSNDFVRVSWDKALDLVAQELKYAKATHGPRSVFTGTYGWKSAGKIHNSRSLLRRLINRGLQMPNVTHTGDYSTGASQVIMPHVMGTLEVYEQQTVWPVVVDNTEVLVVWGADPIKTNQIDWLIADHDSYTYLEEFKKTGKKVICIDPLKSKTAEFMDAEWVQVKPQTDVALMLGMAHTLFVEELYDVDFMDEYTAGFEKFLPYLTGETDQTPKSAEWASEICGVPADKIKELARLFMGNRTMLTSGWSLQRQHHGEQPHWMLVTLASMLGQIGLPGGGFGLSYHYSNGGTPTSDGPALSGMNDGGAMEGSVSIPVARVVEMLERPGEEYDFNGTRYTFPDIKIAYWAGGNPFHHHQDRNRMIKAWQKLETVIVQDYQWTATARFADIVLPAASAYERNDIEAMGSYSNKATVAMKKIVDPVFEARSEYDIFVDLADRLGNKDAYTDGRDEMDWVRHYYEQAQKQAASKNLEMPEFEKFWEDGIIVHPVSQAAKEYVRYADFREDPLLEPLGTPTGKIEIYSKNIEKMGYDDCPPHPMWMEPLERLDGPDAKFPVHVNTGHPNDRLHSQLCGTVLREGYAVADREPCMINPKDAEARGIKSGDVIRIFNDRGQTLAGAIVSEDIMPSVIRLYEGAWYDPVEGGKVGSLCAYGDVNTLTPDLGTSKLAQGNCGHTVIADFEKVEGELPEVKVFTAPKNG